MLVTKRLREFLVAKCNLAPDADEAAVKKCVADAIVAEVLTADQLKDLTDQTDAEKKVRSMIAESMEPITKAIADLSAKLVQPVAAKATVLDPAATQSATASLPQKAMAMAAVGMPAGGGSDDADQIHIRVKSFLENFDDTRTAATYDKSAKQDHFRKSMGGQQLAIAGEGGYGLDMPTTRSKAVAGAWFKFLINKSCAEDRRPVPAVFRMKDIDNKLVEAAMHESRFVGPIGYRDSADGWGTADHWMEGEKMTDLHRKAMLDDTTSGGQYVVPIEFDANVVLTPLLNGELFPRVNVVNVTRRRIESATVGNPTLGWGTADGSAITPFVTTAYVAQFNHNVYPITGAMELGKDFLSDSPIDIGGIIVQRYGERFRQELDNVIANGNGTDRPEGCLTISGVTTVTPAGGAGTAPQVGDYEGLMRTVGKEWLDEAGRRACFFATNTTYWRARGIPVNSTNDARRIFGSDASVRDYNIFGYDFAINNGMGNANAVFACLNRYRMYRRLGLEVRITDEGRTLQLANLQLVVLRARFGGGMESASALAKITQGQA
jgi:HK97 family phage major capsid protein